LKRWYPEVFRSDTVGDADLLKALDAADGYELAYEEARKDLIAHGRLEGMAARMAGLTDQRFAQLQDLEAIIEYLESREKKMWVEKTRHYLEHYQRTLTDKVARDYAETTDEVQLIRKVRQRVGYVRNLFLGIMKGLECMNFQITNVTKLKCAGLEDAEIDGRRHH
jgi:two-component SAPR family response regulator